MGIIKSADEVAALEAMVDFSMEVLNKYHADEPKEVTANQVAALANNFVYLYSKLIEANYIERNPKHVGTVLSSIH